MSLEEKYQSLSSWAKTLINVFTLIETITLTVWAILFTLAVLAFLQGDRALALFWFVLSVVELYVGLLLEHRLAAVSNKV